MGILKRFGEIMASNINALLDKAEDPAKMVDYYERQLDSQLEAVKNQIAGVIAEETRTARELEEVEKEVAKYSNLADRALDKQNEDDAAVFLEKMKDFEEVGKYKKEIYDLAHDNAVKMRQMHDKLLKDHSKVLVRKEKIKAQIELAKARENINKMEEKMGIPDSVGSEFRRLESTVQRELDKQVAIAEIASKPTDAATELEAKYTRMGVDASIAEELERRKAARSAKAGAET